MASQEHKEQPAANPIFSNHKQQKLVVEPGEKSIDNFKAILEVSKTENLLVPGNKTKNWWDIIFIKIRFLLTQSIDNFWTNGNLINVFSVFMVLILSFSVIVLPSKAESEKVAESIETISIPEQEIEVTLDSTSTEESKNSASETISIPEQEIEVIVDSTPTEETETFSQPEEVVSTPVEIETPETLVAPQKPETLTVKTIPLPEPVLTPEQNFLEVVQTRIAEITNQYGKDLIATGTADLITGHLLIEVNDDWYQLSKSRQDEFANEILKRSQKFNLSQLEIQDLQNNLVARSPVVGNQMIILQRTN